MSAQAAEAPLYRQVESQLIEAITKGQYKVGDQLPTEAELCAQHGVSRHTVRQALRRIQDSGMIERRTSAGTRVVSTQPVDRYQPIAESMADILSLAEETRISRPASDEVVADRSLARRLRCRPGTRWFRLSGPRIRRVGAKEPLCWSEQYLLPEYDRTHLLRADFGIEQLRGQRIEQEISADLLDAKHAEALQVEAGSAALVIVRRHYAERRLISVGVHTHPADRFSIRSELVPR